MKLEEIFHNKNAQQKIHDAAVICVQTTEYPLLFCRALINFLSHLFNMPIEVADMENENSSHHMARLQTTFLGQTSWYWLHADAELTKNGSDLWYTFLRTYAGPHKLIFCATKPINQVPTSWCVIQLPDFVNKTMFADISYMVALKQTRFGEHIFKTIQKLPLDAAVLLCSYAQLIGKNSTVFFDDWLPKLVVPEVSLFSLSQALFTRKSHQFFLLWRHLGSMYPTQFWITFWSEQFWRAYCYIRLQNNGKEAEAKKIGYRLPFLFLNSTWRTYHFRELQQAHNLLYSIDYHIKQGGSEYSLELLYAQFLNKLM